MKQSLGPGFTVLIGIAVLIMALSVSYYYVIFLPKEERARTIMQIDKLVREEQETKEQQESLSTCLLTVEQGYHESWAKACKSWADKVAEGIQGCKSEYDDKLCERVWKEVDGGGGDHCSLPLKKADYLNTALHALKDECYKTYPQK